MTVIDLGQTTVFSLGLEPNGRADKITFFNGAIDTFALDFDAVSLLRDAMLNNSEVTLQVAVPE